MNRLNRRQRQSAAEVARREHNRGMLAGILVNAVPVTFLRALEFDNWAFAAVLAVVVGTSFGLLICGSARCHREHTRGFALASVLAFSLPLGVWVIEMGWAR